MREDIFHSRMGYLILFATAVGFFISFAMERFYASILLISGGVLVWIIYVNVSGVKIRRTAGSILVIFGICLFTACFMAFGIEQDMWGGYLVNSEGATLSIIVLFFAVMPGLIFLYMTKPSGMESATSGTQSPPFYPPVETSPAIEPEQYYEKSFDDYEYAYDPDLYEEYYDEEDDEEYEDYEEDE